SACHWCHVMAHESFEDPEVAAEMNRHFVNIKVDREERPDLDQIYQIAHAMLTHRSGGWPLTMFLTPDQTPFFGGTYFPKEQRHGLPGFRDLLGRVAAFYRERQEDIGKQNEAVRDAFGRSLPRRPKQAGAPDADLLERALTELESGFDQVHGGFGDAPKFPHPTELEFSLRRHAANGAPAGLAIATLTLRRMAEGGIYDQVGGGFCRYSVDRTWTIPHFEKMLYDNGPLLRLNADAWVVTGDPLFRRVAEETAEWVVREMQSHDGGYYSTLDADSEHEEGKFYVWTPAEVRALLAPEEYAVLAPHFGLDGPPNFEHQHWHLRMAKPLEGVASSLALTVEDARRRLDAGRAKLFAAREDRVRPGRDEKVLTSWNALMIKGMAHAGRILGKPQWIASGRRALDFIRSTLYRDGRLLAVYKDGQARLNGYLDDYAFLLDAVLEMLAAEFRLGDLDFARELADTLLRQFEDGAEGGFFFTSHDHESLVHRPKAAADNATPSGNGVAAFALQRLGHLMGEPRYLAA
ncbi:MAG TPA: thioredoxin domain-containing protein, partial [Burkholderiales bacterium]